MTRRAALAAVLASAASLVAASGTAPCGTVRNLFLRGDPIPAEVCAPLTPDPRDCLLTLTSTDRDSVPNLRPLRSRHWHRDCPKLSEAQPVPLDHWRHQEPWNGLRKCACRYLGHVGRGDRQDQGGGFHESIPI
jgi:hypothetical protein